MRRPGLPLALALALSTTFATPAFAADPAPAAPQASTADIDRLLEVMDMQAMMAAMMDQVAQAQEPMLVEAFGKDASQADRARMQALMAKANEITRRHMAWPVLEPVVRDVYAQVFSKQEVAAMTAFYATPEGSAILRKSPQAAALTMQKLQPIMVAAMAEVKTAIEAEVAKP
jgi:hypothetical protein